MQVISTCLGKGLKSLGLVTVVLMGVETFSFKPALSSQVRFVYSGVVDQVLGPTPPLMPPPGLDLGDPVYGSLDLIYGFGLANFTFNGEFLPIDREYVGEYIGVTGWSQDEPVGQVRLNFSRFDWDVVGSYEIGHTLTQPQAPGRPFTLGGVNPYVGTSGIVKVMSLGEVDPLNPPVLFPPDDVKLFTSEQKESFGRAANGAFMMSFISMYLNWMSLAFPGPTSTIAKPLDKIVNGFPLGVEGEITGGVVGKTYKSLNLDWLRSGVFLRKLSLDPPDLDFTTLVKVVEPFPGQPFTVADVETQQLADAINALVANQVVTNAYLDALYTSMNRVGGARLSGDVFWEDKQLRSAHEFSLTIGDLIAEQPALYEALGEAFRAMPEFADVQFTVDDLIDFQESMRVNGLSSQLLQGFNQSGIDSLTQSQILEELLSLDLSQADIWGGGNFPNYLTDPLFISSLNTVSQSFKEGVVIYTDGTSHAVPEPLTWLGSVVALFFGFLFKKSQVKN